MRAQTFYQWLLREAATSRMALIGLYEKRDRILYVEAPPLRKKYMELIGAAEEPVIRAELETALLRRKLELMQIAANRREPIDLGAIDAQLERERAERVSELESADRTLAELPVLTVQQEHTIQRQYHEITRTFHPAMTADLTQTQKELYQKAIEAYKMQDVEAMKLIYDQLFSPLDPEDAGETSVTAHMEDTPESRRAEYREIAAELSTDYLLARQLYGCFVPLEEDAVVLDTLRSYDEQRAAVEDEIAQIRAGFPFIAAETMDDPAKTGEYLAELRVRARQCELEKAELVRRIAFLAEDAAHG